MKKKVKRPRLVVGELRAKNKFETIICYISPLTQKEILYKNITETDQTSITTRNWIERACSVGFWDGTLYVMPKHINYGTFKSIKDEDYQKKEGIENEKE